VGHAFLDIYQLDPSKERRLKYVKERMDELIANPVREWHRYGSGASYEDLSLRWTWCDALYMAPPTLARLSHITGDQKYNRFNDYEFRICYDELWDPEEKLFYRDNRFPTMRTENGKKIFWSRGNGWVYGGLALLLDYLPENDVARPFYEKLFLEMTEGILSAQQPSGLWRPNLRDPLQVPTGEASGTGFFLYGLAWGINNGYLDKETYWPKIVKGWKGLLTRVQANGMVGYVQPVGFDPRNNVTADNTQVYGAGAFLLAGSEILKVLGATTSKTSEEIYQEAESMVEAGEWERPIAAWVVPHRKDDIAWENDKVAFRVYGPDLKSSTENSGIDVWKKRVETPVIKKWYDKDYYKTGSYHQDTGEGYDVYKVGAARGCGGTGLVYNGKLYTSNVYTLSLVYYTPDDYMKIRLDYVYDVEGHWVRERKIFTLRGGEYLCHGVSSFAGSKEVLNNAMFAIGLTSQAEDAKVLQDQNKLVIWDSVDGYSLATAVKLESGYDASSVELSDRLGEKNDHLLLTPLGEGNKVSYRFGFAWERHSDFESISEWMKYVSSAE